MESGTENRSDPPRAEPAFPCPRGIRDDGMTLRDYFAAKAMQSMAAPTPCNMYDIMARNAYAVADAMLNARR